MKKKLVSIVLSLTMAATCFMPVTGVSANEKSDAGAKSAKGKISAVMDENTTFAERVEGVDAPYAAEQLIVVYDQETTNKEIRSDAKAVGNVSDINKSDGQKMALVDLNTDDMTEAAQQLEAEDNVLYVQPNYCYTLLPEPATNVQKAKKAKNDMQAQEAGSVPDPFLDPANGVSYQYYIKTTNAEEAWNLIEANPSHGQTIVGIVDTGVDSRHADLKNNLITIDDKGKYRGFMLGEPRDLYDDTDEHGTHCSGIVGAEYGNGLGGSGVASGHNNDLVKVLTTCAAVDDGLFSYDICKAIDYNVEHGARVISMSFGGSGYDVMMELCIRKHYEEDGTVFVAASGNDETNSYSSPCDFSTVIAVNASTVRGEAAYFSDYGKFKDIAAPGFNIMSTLPGDRFGMMSGTSMATPAVAGICGLILDMNPNLTPAQVRNIICSSTTEAQKGIGFATDLAYGNIDALAAVKAAVAASASVSPTEVSIKEDAAIEKTVVNVGSVTALTAHVLPAECLQPVSWSSSAPGIAAVDQTGRITGIREGKATITASCGGLSATADVIVKGGLQPTSVKIKDREELQEMECHGDSGMYGQLWPEVTPAGAVVPDVSFESSNPEVLFADGTGFYQAKKPGTATLTMLGADGTVLDSIEVKVMNPVRHIAFTSKTNKIKVGGSFTFSAEVLDENPYHPEITWSVSNKRGTIDPVTGEFTAKKKGACYVIAGTENGAYKAERVVIKDKKAKKKTKKSKKGASVLTRRDADGNRIPVRVTSNIGTEPAKPRLQEDMAEFGIQMAEEIVQDVLGYTPVTETYYSPEVIRAINQTTDELMEYVKAHPDEIQIQWFFILVSEEIYDQVGTLESLAELTREKYTGSVDNPRLKKLLKESYQSVVQDMKRKQYNDWYWDKFCAMRDSAKAALGDVTDLQTYLEASTEDLFRGYTNSYLTIDSYYDSLREYLLDYEVTDKTILTKRDLKTVTATGQSMLNKRQKRGEKNGFKPSKKLAAQMKQFKKKASKMIHLQDIVLLHESIMEAWDAEYDAFVAETAASDPEGPLTNSDKVRMEQKMLKLYFSFDHNDYSDSDYDELWSIYSDYIGQLRKCKTHAELQKVWNKYEKAMYAVPTK